MIPVYIKKISKIIGYFSYSGVEVFCDGDACIIAGSEERLKFYLKKLSRNNQKNVIKKTRFGELLEGMREGGVYAFDEEAYQRFFDLAKINGITFSVNKECRTMVSAEIHFIRVQFFE